MLILEANFQSLEVQKAQLVGQLKSISSKIDSIVNANSGSFLAAEIAKEIPALVKEPSIEMEIEEEAVEEEVLEEIAVAYDKEQDEIESHGISFSSAVNEINLESSQSDKTNLEIIEGIGPKIKEVLNNARVITFRDLATTPIYRIKDILDAAGSQFSAHDPSTWVEQALLAENGQWEQLEDLRSYLVAGRVPKADIIEEKSKPEANSESGSTEEMLDKVNKVKAAIRKAMVEKAEPKEPKSVNDFIAEKKQSGSFFDNLN
jgi:cell division initiation protein